MGDRTTTLLLGIPALILAGGALLRSVPGEWSQSALLAFAAVALGFVTGQLVGATPLAALGLALGFVALAVGGATGLTGLAVVYGVLAAAAFAGTITAPWPAALVLAAACAVGAGRGLLH